MKEFDEVYACYKKAIIEEKARNFMSAFKEMRLAFDMLLKEYQDFIATKFKEL